MFTTILLFVITSFLLLFPTVYFYFLYKFGHWSREKVPYLEPKFPYGNTETLVRMEKCFGECFADIYCQMKKITRQYGGMFMFSRPSLMIMDLNLIRTILTKDFAYFQNRGMFYDKKANPLGANLIALEGQEWKTLRTKLTPTFSSAKMKMLFEIMLETSNELKKIIAELINQKKLINSRDVLARLTTDTIGCCAFGIQCNSLRNPDAEFRVFGKKIFEINPRTIIVNILATNFPSLLRILKISQISPDVTKFFTDVLKQTIEYRERNKIERNDLLDILIKLKNSSKEDGITFNELAAQSFAFFAAGFETSSSTINFALYELSCNVEIQEKLRTEINEKIKDNNFTYENVAEMKYLDQVICEVLRKYPPIPTLQRECNQDYKIPNCNYTIKKGTKIVIPTMGMHLDSEYFPNPEVFNPDNFAELEKQKRNPYTYLPFGEGPRICIGMRFAQLQVKVTLAILIKNFKFNLDPASFKPLELNPRSIFLSPKTDILLHGENL